MTEETKTEAAQPKKRGGWPKGKARAAKPAPTTAPALVRPAAAAARPSMLAKMKARPNWDDDTIAGVGEEGADRLKIPDDIVQALARDGVALQWGTRSVRGQETPRELSKMTKGGWTQVHQSDFDGLLDGMFMSKGVDDVIGVDDCVLMARPIEINHKARRAMLADARAPLLIKEQEVGRGIPVSGGDHPTARAGNRIKTTMERVEIPE